MHRKAEEVRIRYLYRNLILRGKIRLPLEAARQMVGPDCAYRLYATADVSATREMGKPAQEARRKLR